MLSLHTFTSLRSCADIDNIRFTSQTVDKAKADYKKMYYGMSNLAPAKKKGIEKVVFATWEAFKKERGIKQSRETTTKKARVA